MPRVDQVRGRKRPQDEGSRVCARPSALKLVEDAIVFIQITQFPSQMIVDRNRFHRPRVHIDVPNLERQIVPRKDIPPIVAELDVRDRRNDLRKE